MRAARMFAGRFSGFVNFTNRVTLESVATIRMIRYDTVHLRALKSWRYVPLNVARGSRLGP